LLATSDRGLNSDHGGDASRKVSNIVDATSDEALERFEPINLILSDRLIEVKHLHYSDRPTELVQQRSYHVALIILAAAGVVNVSLEVYRLQPLSHLVLLFLLIIFAVVPISF
jgi:hypothetical protein